MFSGRRRAPARGLATERHVVRANHRRSEMKNSLQRRRLSVFGLFLMISCHSETEPHPTIDRLPGAEEEVQVSALTWAFGSVETNLNPPAAYCVALERAGEADMRDPPATLLARLQTAAAPARPVSECRFGGLLSDGSRYDDSRNVVIDRTTDGFALYFGIFPVRWESGDVAIIDLAYTQGGLWGAGYECRVEHRQGVWQVIDCQKTYES